MALSPKNHRKLYNLSFAWDPWNQILVHCCKFSISIEYRLKLNDDARSSKLVYFESSRGN